MIFLFLISCASNLDSKHKHGYAEVNENVVGILETHDTALSKISHYKEQLKQTTNLEKQRELEFLIARIEKIDNNKRALYQNFDNRSNYLNELEAAKLQEELIAYFQT